MKFKSFLNKKSLLNFRGYKLCRYFKAATTFSEPFIVEGRYLRMAHKNLSGKMHSDHIALLMAFQQWLKAKWRSEEAEQEFCDRKSLNLQILRMTYEARNQLKDIMLFSGFPEDCMMEGSSFDANVDDPRLDTITSLLAYALYPNVCYHMGKRKLLTHEGKLALIHKGSVNCGHDIAPFPSPFFVFGEKIKTRAVSAKSMTMVTPVQLLLFSSDSVELIDAQENLVCLDNWIYLKLEPTLAAQLASVRSILDSVMATCTIQPEVVTQNARSIELFTRILRMLSEPCGQHIIIQQESQSQPLIPSTMSSLFQPSSSSTSSMRSPNFNKRVAYDSNNFNSNNNNNFNNNNFNNNNNNNNFNNNRYSNNNNNFNNNNRNFSNNQPAAQNRFNSPAQQPSTSSNQPSNIPLPPHLMSGNNQPTTSRNDNFQSNNFRNQNFNNRNFQSNNNNNNFNRNNNNNFNNNNRNGGFNNNNNNNYRNNNGNFNNNRNNGGRSFGNNQRFSN